VTSQGTYLELATNTYAEQIRSLTESSGARRYLTEHGIGEYWIASRYRLGFVAEPLPGDERFQGMLSIPYITATGVRALKFRRLSNGDGKKYDQHHGQKPRLYNSNAFYDANDSIGLCEGEIDAIVATERLGIPTMGVPGSSVWTQMSQFWTPVFQDFRTVFVFADGDDAGKRLAGDVAESLGWRARLVYCDPGEDVASMVKAGLGHELQAKCKLAGE